MGFLERVDTLLLYTPELMEDQYLLVPCHKILHEKDISKSMI